MLQPKMPALHDPEGPRVPAGLATVFPGEADDEVILQEAFDAGLDGLKLHAHVQCFDRYRSDRIMYGSDFPNIPYAWDRELKALEADGLSREFLEQITYTNAVAFFGL